MKYLIIGARGQLGREFSKRLDNLGENFISFGREELNIVDFSNVLDTLRKLNPQIVINCSAYNHVDKAEAEFGEALSVNCVGVSNLAIACREIGAFLVHYSTDYVFDGEKQGFYLEDDVPNPLSRYGLSKYLGEMQLIRLHENHLLFRTSWVYGEGKQNFLYKLSKWAEVQEYLRITCDEYSVPTSTRTIVEITMLALKKGLTGLYHLVNEDYASRYEWAREYLRLKGIKKLIYPAYQHEFNLPAKRPRWSVMSPQKLSNELGFSIKSWQDEMKELVKDCGL